MIKMGLGDLVVGKSENISGCNCEIKIKELEKKIDEILRLLKEKNKNEYRRK